MAAKDVFHDAVKNALLKDGWAVTHDPLFLRAGGVEMMIDLGAEKLMAAERDGQRIAVEVKSFIGPPNISAFHTALGQFLNYRLALNEQEGDRTLFLAVPSDTYETFFTLQFIQRAIVHYELKLLVYDPGQEVIVKWQQ